MDGEFARRRGYIPHERIGIDEFGIDPIGAVAFAQSPKSGIRDIFHWGEIQRAVSHFSG